MLCGKLSVKLASYVMQISVVVGFCAPKLVGLFGWFWGVLLVWRGEGVSSLSEGSCFHV